MLILDPFGSPKFTEPMSNGGAVKPVIAEEICKSNQKLAERCPGLLRVLAKAPGECWTCSARFRAFRTI